MTAAPGVYDPDQEFPEANRDNWRLYAACLERDPEEFFPESLNLQRQVARFCHEFCPAVVRKSCLEHALRAPIKQGVAGGMTERERAKLAPDYSPWSNQ